MSISPITSRSALPIPNQKPAAPAEPGSKPYTRSSSAPSPHIAGARGDLGNPRVNVNSNGVPERLLGVHSNGQPFVAFKAGKNEQPGAQPFVRGDAANSSIRGGTQVHAAPAPAPAPKNDAPASAPSPHIAGAAGKLGSPVVNVNKNGVPTHIIGFESNGKPFVAQKV